MSDIKIRLRTTGDPWPQYADVPLCVEAAKKIDELEAEIERLRRDHICVVATLRQTEAEVERLRAEAAWLRRLLTWCRARLRREEYKGALDRYLAAGPTDVDDTKMTNAALTGGKE